MAAGGRVLARRDRAALIIGELQKKSPAPLSGTGLSESA